MPNDPKSRLVGAGSLKSLASLKPARSIGEIAVFTDGKTHLEKLGADQFKFNPKGDIVIQNQDILNAINAARPGGSANPAAAEVEVSVKVKF